MTYLNREEIVEFLNKQFASARKSIKSGEWTAQDAKTAIKSENDVCDQIEPNSGNYQLAREMQDEFIVHELS